MGLSAQTSRRSGFREDRLAWIFGSSRSGSTWLLRMLSELRGVVPIDDPHLGHHLGVWRPIPLAWGAGEEPPDLTMLPELMADAPDYFFSDRYRDDWWGPLRRLIEARFEAQIADRGPTDDSPTCIVKEPGSQAAQMLADLFPRSKLIFLLRDGRDVVDSWMDAYQEGSWAIRKGAFSVADEGRIPLIRWLSAVWSYRSRTVAQAFETRPPESRLLVRYESLRERPAACLAEICETLDLDRAGIPRIVRRHSFERARIRGPRHEVRSARPGAWRYNLTAEEQAAMHEVLGEALEQFGYATPVPAA